MIHKREWTLFLLSLCLQICTGQCQDLVKPADLRIVLLGKTGSGKSSTGNTILGREAFKTDSSAESVTLQSKKRSGKVNGRMIHVIDTPGLFGTTLSDEEMNSEIQKAIYMSEPGPHVFLLVIRLGVKFTEEEKNVVNWIEENFGQDASIYTIVLFTHGDQLGDKSVEEVLKQSRDLRRLVNRCEGRYHSVINDKRKDKTQVTELLKKIEQMVEDNGERHYSSDIYEAERKITEERMSYCVWRASIIYCGKHAMQDPPDQGFNEYEGQDILRMIKEDAMFYCKMKALAGIATTAVGMIYASPALITTGVVGAASSFECIKEYIDLYSNDW